MNETDLSPRPARADTLDEMLRATRAELAAVRRDRDRLAERYRLSQTREGALGQELQHPVRNMLAVIRSILRRTLEAASFPEAFAEHFGGRLDAISRYQTRGAQHRLIELEDIIRDELLATGCLDTPACAVAGPLVQLDEEFVEPIALAIHELATNAFKFGALRHEDGTLDIGWTVAEGLNGATLTLRWAEGGVPVIAAAPPIHGFGRRYIEEALPYQLSAATSFEFRPGGIVCTIALPLGRGRSPAGHAADRSGSMLPQDRPEKDDR